MKKLLRNDKKSDAEKLLKSVFTVGDEKAGESQAERDSTEYWYLNGMLNQYSFEKLNVNVYLSNKVDTTQYYDALYTMYCSFQKCYNRVSADDKLLKPIQTAMKSFKDNLGRGGNYFIQKKQFEKSYKYYRLYIDLVNNQQIECNDSLLHRVYYNAMVSAGKIKNYDEVVSLAKACIKKGYRSEEIDLMLCDALKTQGRIAEWLVALDDAVKYNPNQFYFYGSLIDYYIKEGRNNEALKYAEDLVKKDSTNYLNCFVQAYVFQHVNNYDSAVIWYNISLKNKPDFVPTLSALGYCYIQLAEKKAASINRYRLTTEEKLMVNSYYEKAQIHLETCQKLAPNDKNLWVAGLYTIYYHLNNGEKLEQIERMLE